MATVNGFNHHETDEFRYLEEGKARFNALLITLNNDSLEDWGDKLLEELVPYVGGIQASLYVVSQDDGNRLELMATYGQLKDHLPTHLRFGEGMIGQCAKSRKQFFITNPKAIKTQSFTSLAFVHPKALLVMPLIYNQIVEGVLEVTAPVVFPNRTTELLRLLSESIAANLSTIINQKKITRLYDEAQNKSALLEDKEKRMRVYIEDLEATQNEMRKLQDNLELTVQQRTRQLETALTELQDAQNQIVQSEKLVSLGQLVAGVAHEINTPIGIAVTAASTLESLTYEFNDKFLENKVRKSDLEEYVSYATESSRLILKNLERAAQLIQSFKKVAVNQVNDDLADFSLKSFLDEVLTSLSPQIKKSGVKLDLIIEVEEGIMMYSSMSAISQIVINFVMNSIIHGFEKGKIAEGKLTFQAHVEGPMVIFKYSDTGKGIPTEIIPKIFDPFFTTKRNQGGSGLGLNIVHNLVVQSLKGKIKAESIVGKGTTFTIVMPQSIA